MDLLKLLDGHNPYYFCLIILLLPFLATIIQIFIGRFLPRKGDWVSICAVFGSFLFSLMLFFAVFQKGGIKAGEIEPFNVNWIAIGNFKLSMGILFDSVTAVMLLVVTLVSFLVHLFSIGYMHGDSRYSRFYAYLSLFTFSMLGLVLSDNLIALYIFWELVGLCSYLLIGFWFEKPSAASACKKAFITNRFGDFGFFLGILIIIYLLWTRAAGLGINFDVTYLNVFRFAADGGMAGSIFGMSILTFTSICLFLGAVGKSAQFPLHIWLPDAMEGPTPVSALIHAATMVAAGVYMVTRLFVLFTPSSLAVVAYTGGFTALFAATIAITATDIKKVLAYSTISQLGYMVLGLGVGGYIAGFYHLWTHAYFKALLFLCSGSVIHAVHTQEMPEMGGLWKKMPVTFFAMLMGTLAISGFPPKLVSGYYSKDEILLYVYAYVLKSPQHFLLAVFGFVGAGLTAFYMFRLIFMTFSGSPRDKEKHEHAHESPFVMWFPLAVLAILAICSAGFGENSKWFGHMIGEKPTLAQYSSSSHIEAMIKNVPTDEHLSFKVDNEIMSQEIGHGIAHNDESEEHYLHLAHKPTIFIALIIVIIGILLAILTYWERFRKISAEKIVNKIKPIHKLLSNKYYIDELAQALIIQPAIKFAKFCASFDFAIIDGLVNISSEVTKVIASYIGLFDNKAVDGAVNLTAESVLSAGEEIRGVSTGKIKNYLAWVVGGVVGLCIICYLLLILM